MGKIENYLLEIIRSNSLFLFIFSIIIEIVILTIAPLREKISKFFYTYLLEKPVKFIFIKAKNHLLIFFTFKIFKPHLLIYEQVKVYEERKDSVSLSMLHNEILMQLLVHEIWVAIFLLINIFYFATNGFHLTFWTNFLILLDIALIISNISTAVDYMIITYRNIYQDKQNLIKKYGNNLVYISKLEEIKEKNKPLQERNE